MRNYVKNELPTREPQLLRLAYKGRFYKLDILHAEDEHYCDHIRQLFGSNPKPHAHDVYHITLYVKGNNEFYLKDRMHPCQRGTLAVVSPGELHEFGLRGTGDAVSIELTFIWRDEQTGECLRLPFHKVLSLLTGLRLPEITYPAQLQEDALQCMEYLCDILLDRLVKGGTTVWYASDRLMLEIFNAFMETLYIPELRKRPGLDCAEDPLNRARSEIRARFNEDLSLKEIAEKACLSESHFGRVFKKEFGISPMAYQQQLRIDAAKVFLCTSSVRISRVAEKTGYSDSFAFSKTFKKATGMSPREFRAAGNYKIVMPESVRAKTL